MKKWLKHDVSNDFTLALAFINDRMRKFFAIVVLIALLGSLIPRNQVIKASQSEPFSPILESIQNETDNQKIYQSTDLDSSQMPIELEDLSLRMESEKVFKKIDGTYEMAFYNEAVHYLDGGTWKDINNSLIFDSASDSYHNQANKFRIKFPNSIDDNRQIQLSMYDYSIDWKMLNIEKASIDVDDIEKNASSIKELTCVHQSVIYKNVQVDTDLQYVLTGTTVKENIILKAYTSKASFDFEYKTKGLSIEKDSGGNLVFMDDEGKIEFSFGSLYMIDSMGNSSSNIKINMIPTGNKTYIITITPDDSWLKTATFPVTIDPTLVSTSTNMSINTTYISEIEHSTNYSSSPIMYVSGLSTSSEYRGLLSFSIPSTVMSKTITYAHLQFSKNSLVTGKQINLYKNTETFSKLTATWDNAPEFDYSVVDYYIVNSQTPMIFDITESVKEWQITGSNMATGFTITEDGWYGDIMSVFQVFSYNPSVNPVISIGFQDPSGLKDYWTYTSQEMGRVGTGYISDYTGNLTWVRNEYSLNHEYLPMTLSFYHNNYTRTIDIGYGDGWRNNYNVQILKDTDYNRYYLLKPDGSRLYFSNETSQLVYSGVYLYTSIAEDGSRMIMQRYTNQGVNSSFKLTTSEDMKYSFNANGRLTDIYNLQTLQYLWVYYIDSTSLKIDYILDEADNRIDFTYNTGNTQLTMTEMLLKQVDSSLRGVEKHLYYYDSYNNIDYIKCYYRYGTGTDTAWSNNYLDRLEYSFDSTNRLKYTYDYNNSYKVQYAYDVNNRVSNYIITDSGSYIGNTSVTYSSMRTEYTDYEGNSLYYTFDNYGHTINLMDDYGNASYYRYSGLFSYDFDTTNPENGYGLVNMSPNYFNNNNLIESSDVLKQHQNPINNHGFEEVFSGWTLNPGMDGQIGYSTAEAVLGEYSLLMTKNTSVVYASQSVYLKAGEYTINAWIKNNGTSGGAFVDVIGETTCGTISKVLNSSEWKNYILTFTLASNTTVELRLINESASTAYFDNIQISDGFQETRYNAVNNNSFEEGSVSWSMSGATVVAISETDIMEKILGENAITISGNGTTNKYFYQTITNLVTVGETYVVGGWAKADAVPNKAYWNNAEIADNRFFGLYVSVYCVPIGTPGWYQYYYLPFNSNVETWQYQMRSFTVPEFAVNVKIYGKYQGEGIAYFDNIQLYHDKLSTSYGYHSENGNLMSIEKPNGSITNMEYDATNHIISIEKNDRVTYIEHTGTYQISELFTNNVRATLEYNSITRQLNSVYMGYNNEQSTQDNW
jgi:hypothetical protein